MTDKPTPKEIENLFVEETGFDIDDFPAAIFDFARAVLDKWGTPAPVGVEPYGWHYWNIAGTSVLHLGRSSKLDADIDISKKHPDAHHVVPLYTTPQPTHAQAGAVPLTDGQIKALMQAHRTAMLMTCKARVPECGEFAAIAQDLDWLCESFGIKGGQHG